MVQYTPNCTALYCTVLYCTLSHDDVRRGVQHGHRGQDGEDRVGLAQRHSDWGQWIEFISFTSKPPLKSILNDLLVQILTV